MHVKNLNEKAWYILGLFILGTFLFPTVASAQSDITNRINRLENELQTLNRAVYRGEKVPAPNFGTDSRTQAASEVRLQQLETEIRTIRGSIEEQGHEIRKMNSKLDKALSDMQLRIGDLEKKPAAPAQQGAFQAPSNLSTENVQTFTWNSSPTEKKASGSSAQAQDNLLKAASSGEAASVYESAFSFLKSNKYEQAAKGFDSFIRQYPKHALVGNAKYWLGETHYVRGNYEQASRIFAEGYKEFPKGSKAPDNLLKLGMSLAGSGNKQDACVAFLQLKTEFSSSAIPVLRRAEQEMSRLGCAA